MPNWGVAPGQQKAAFVRVELSTKQLAAFEKRMKRWQGAPLALRANKGTEGAGKYMAALMKKMAPRSNKATRLRKRAGAKSGNLRRSIKVRTGKRGFFKTVYVGPTAPHSFLVTRGTGEHGLTPKRGGSDLQLLPLQGVGRGGGPGWAQVAVRTGSGMRHPGTQPNPFVDVAKEQHHGDAFRIINQALFSE